MDRRFFLTICGGAMISALPALAGSFEDAVVRQLRAQGFGQITVETTLLGRVRIVAHSKAGRREIVLNPRTGEVLRDVLTAVDGSVAPVIANSSGGSGGGNSGSGDDGGSSGGGSDDHGGSGDDGGSDDSGGSGDDGGSDDNSGSGDSGGSDDGGDDGSESESESSDSEDDGKDD